uniref:Exostosin GT47 domain-containing protein n=2 Tax=Haptolina ericina TaxID=156174 RepID=A0A7S3BR44_9EUKA|mmetsp:Transcript_64756/g.144691  ORF Transcript_64756/g.144691 Transcript_64756/m.144691 type:complete len:194 (+) Transcript_64756:77-658(+)
MSRGKADTETYAHMMRRARFCLAPTGELPTPGRRLVDAIAAGCVPILVGDVALPFAQIIDYKRFCGFISRRSFLSDPVEATEKVLHELEPRRAQLLQALADARQRLLYGTGDLGPYHNATLLGGVGELILREVAAARAQPSPSSPSSIADYVDFTQHSAGGFDPGANHIVSVNYHAPNSAATSNPIAEHFPLY